MKSEGKGNEKSGIDAIKDLFGKARKEGIFDEAGKDRKGNKNDAQEAGGLIDPVSIILTVKGTRTIKRKR